MKKPYKIIIISLIVIILIAITYFGAIIGSGNYGYSQKYSFETSNVSLIKAVENLKAIDSTFVDSIGIPDSLDDSNSHFNAEIHSKKENISFAFFITKDNMANKSFIYLVSVNKGTDVTTWKIVNRDLDRVENLKVKTIFEKEILNKLKINYKNNGNGMFIFWK